jgi:hypothetical protein
VEDVYHQEVLENGHIVMEGFQVVEYLNKVNGYILNFNNY